MRRRLAKKLGIEVQSFTAEQIASLGNYREKWRKVALQLGPIDRQKAALAVQQLYAANDAPYEPEIIFADGPYTARRLLKHRCRRGQQPICPSTSGYQLINKLWPLIADQLSNTISQQLHAALLINRSSILAPLSGWTQPEALTAWCSLCDFCISALKCVHNSNLWAILQGVVTECGWLFPAQHICVVCDRPIQLLVDDLDRLHAENGPAIVYADGYRVRALHGQLPQQSHKQSKSSPQTQIKLQLTESSAKIKKLTEAQDKQVSLYRKKWEAIALAPGSINRALARVAVQSAYSLLNLPPPDILFRPSPCAAVETVVSRQFGNPLSTVFITLLTQTLLEQVASQLDPILYRELHIRLRFLPPHSQLLSIEAANQELLYPLVKTLPRLQRNRLKNCIKPQILVEQGALLDFCISVLRCTHDSIRWEALQLLVRHCGWIYPYRQACVVCDPPIQIALNPGTSLHLATTTLLFSDGHSLQYSYDDSNNVSLSGLMWLIHTKYK